MQQNKRAKFLTDVAYWVVIAAAVYVAFKYLIHLVMPFFLAFVFASVLRPVIRFLVARLHFKRNITAVLCVGVFFSLISGAGVFLAARAVSGAGKLIVALPAYYSSAIEPGLMAAAEWFESVVSGFDPALESLTQGLVPGLISSIEAAVTEFSGKAAAGLANVAAKVPGLLLSGIICVISTVFMAVDYDKIAAFIMRQLPDRAKTLVGRIRTSLVSIIGNYGKSYLLILLMTFGELAVGLLLIRVERPVFIAALIAVMDIFPIVGAGLALLPWAVISLIQGNPARGLCLLALYVVIVVIRQIMEPRIIGRHVGLHPLVTLFCMFVGTSLFGGIGLFGLPILVAILQNLNDGGVIHLYRAGDGEDTSG